MLSYSSQRPTDIDQWAPRVATRRRLIRVATDWGGQVAQTCLDSQQGRDLVRSACPLNIGLAKPPMSRPVQVQSTIDSFLNNTPAMPMSYPPESFPGLRLSL